MTTVPSLPSSLAQAYGLTPRDFSFIAEVQNTVFSFAKNGGEFVLRLTPESHRSFEQVQAEVDWLRHLASHDLRLSAPVAAEDGGSGRRIEWENQIWTAVAFTRAPGRIGSAQDWNSKTFHAWGAMTGRLHLAAETYDLPSPRRQDWKRLLPAGQPEGEDEHLARRKLAALVEQIGTLPGSPEHFGLIHSDLHFWNFAIDDAGPTVFDFDNCEYHWFLADAGTAAFEAATCVHQRLPRQEFLIAFLGQFLAGYREVRDPGSLLPRLADFVKLRELLIFLILSRRWKNRQTGPFQKAFFTAMRNRVVNEEPFLAPETMAVVLDRSIP